MILDTAPQLYDNINLFGLDGHLGGGCLFYLMEQHMYW